MIFATEFFVLITAFFIGLLVKLTDLIVDDKLNFIKYAEYVFGLSFGLLVAYLITNTNLVVASLWFGLVLGVIITNKINHPAHIAGLVSFLFYLSFVGLPALNLFYVVLFAFFTALDEIIEEKIKHKEKLINLLKKFIGLELVSFVVSLITGIWLVFLSILFFDLAYIFVARIFQNKLKF